MEVTKLSTRGLDDADLVGAGVVPVSGRPLILRPKTGAPVPNASSESTYGFLRLYCQKVSKVSVSSSAPPFAEEKKTHVSQSRAGHWKKCKLLLGWVDG